VKAGGNSMRTWGTENVGNELEECQRRGITLTVGMWLGHRSYFNYDDPVKVKEQYEKVQSDVTKFKDHPAVLMWALGNEMEVDNNDREATWRAIEDLAKLCKQLDPNHPTMTVVADVNKQKVENLKKWAPSIDILGINSYGGLPTLPKRLKEYGWDKPYVVTEFGPVGPWERPKTPWGAALEPTSSEKAVSYRSNYENSIKSQSGWCLGSYAFLWGDKQEETPTWFGMFLPSGERTEAIDVMALLWTGKAPANRAPQIQGFEFSHAQQEASVGAKASASIKATDPDGDKLTVKWEVRKEASSKRYAGEGEVKPGVVNGLLEGVTSPTVQFNVPRDPGAYRVYVYVKDGKGNAATANMPFAVK
ncbi:MAG: hypothetical protein H7Y17_05765, partial [Chlorobia bacterium]|nr:hypothetical protein [Fimbriimonadaceae bacterium]